MKNKLIFLSDIIFISIIAFLMVFIILSYYINKPYSYIISLSLTVIISLIYYIRRKKRSIKEMLSKKEKEAIFNMTNQLNFYSKSEQISFLSKALDKKNIPHSKLKDKILLKDKNNNDIGIFMNFSFENITKTQIVSVFNSVKKDTISYIITGYSDEIKSFSLRFNGKINLIDENEFYKFLSEIDFLPENKMIYQKEKLHFKDIIVSLIDRKKAKKFCLIGITFIFMSYFVPLKIYYIVSGVFFLMLSLISLLFGREKNNI